MRVEIIDKLNEAHKLIADSSISPDEYKKASKLLRKLKKMFWNAKQ